VWRKYFLAIEDFPSLKLISLVNSLSHSERRF
jgi:hypothetical protein